jgi:hypothetical protein
MAKRDPPMRDKSFGKLLALFSPVYAALGFFMARTYNVWADLLAAGAAPLCGRASVRLAKRVQRIGGLLEGFRTVRERRDVLDTAFAHRARMVDAANAVRKAL